MPYCEAEEADNCEKDTVTPSELTMDSEGRLRCTACLEREKVSPPVEVLGHPLNYSVSFTSEEGFVARATLAGVNIRVQADLASLLGAKVHIR